MVAEIFPLSPKSPEFHFITRGADGCPFTATLPLTAPEAHPSDAAARTETAGSHPMPRQLMPSLP
jgi:hypothetical protein